LLVLWFYFSLYMYMCIKPVLLHTKIIDLFVCVKDWKHNSNAILHIRLDPVTCTSKHSYLSQPIFVTLNSFYLWYNIKGYCQFMFGENECWNFCFYVSVSEVQEPDQGNQRRTASKTPKRCSLCRHPMKGHSKVSTCPKNQKKQS